MKKHSAYYSQQAACGPISVWPPILQKVRVAYSGGSQVLMLAKADGSLDKALHSQVKWVQFASGADALNYFASNAIDIANFGSSPATAGIVRKLPVEIIGVSGVIASYERLIGKDGINTIKDIEGKTRGLSAKFYGGLCAGSGN